MTKRSCAVDGMIFFGMKVLGDICSKSQQVVPQFSSEDAGYITTVIYTYAHFDGPWLAIVCLLICEMGF